MTSVVSIKQLTSRLESSVSAERIDALQELQAASRTSPDAVGEYALKNVFDLLRSQSSSEEYSEALDLTSRLIKTRDRDASMKNTERIISDEGNVELLLDLLEHSDMMVGVMTSEILTELHSNDREGLEAQIQRCPDGMNKLLQRLPDNSREEVRNQAIVLIQQLTSRNEEMKKTVVFNEGFDILFRIISEEGGSSEASLVVSDCLKICNNILLGSETCQRLFFAMGSEWILRLSDFFNPMLLETMDISYNTLMDQEANQHACWFDESNRLSCAVLAMAILVNSLQHHNVKHQSVIADTAATVFQSAMYWIGRNGPTELLVASLSLLDVAVTKNAHVAHLLSNMFVKIAPNSRGKNMALEGDVATLQYAWKPLPTDERRCISLLALLAERYVIPCRPWHAVSTSIIQGGDLGLLPAYTSLLAAAAGEADASTTMTAANPFLTLFHRIMSVDSVIPDTSVQYVLAPPPPPMGLGGEDDDDHDLYEAAPAVLESMRPVCSILLQQLILFCEKLTSGHMQHAAGLGVSHTGTLRPEIESAERLLHLLTVVFMNASLLGRELSTAISTNHFPTSLDMPESKAIVPFILSAIGRAARLPGGLGYPLVKASMLWLATVVCGCERATRMVFEDPSNLFVVDLATSSSESAGVPAMVQVSVCFFLACCLLALPPEAPESSEGGGNDSNGNTNGSGSGGGGSGGGVLKRRAFLTVIDSRIGLNRFTETLKKPLITVTRKPTAAAVGGSAHATAEPFFFLPEFRVFYETQVQNVKDVIFEMYSGVGGHVTGMEGAHLQVITVQKAKIQELEEKLRDYQQAAAQGTTTAATATVNGVQQQLAEATAQAATLTQTNEQLQAQLVAVEEALATSHANEASLSHRLQESLHDLQQELSNADDLRQEHAALQRVLDEREQAMQTLIATNEDLLAQHRQQAERWRQQEEAYEVTILQLKETVLQEAAAKKHAEETLDQRNQKIFLLESELTELQVSRPTELLLMQETQRKVHALEAENQRLAHEWSHCQEQCTSLQQEVAQLQQQLQQQLEQQQQQASAAAMEGGPEAPLLSSQVQELEETIATLRQTIEEQAQRIQTLTADHHNDNGNGNGASAANDTPQQEQQEQAQQAQALQAQAALVRKYHDHITRLIQEVTNTAEIMGPLPSGVCDDGEEEHDDDGAVDALGQPVAVDPDDHRLVRAIHTLQNLRLAVSFVAGESSEIYEGLNLPMTKLSPAAEGTLGRCYEVVLELHDVFLQRGDQLLVEMDTLKANLEVYEQKVRALDAEKTATTSVEEEAPVDTPAANTADTPADDATLTELRHQLVALEAAVEDWKDQAEENDAKARHWATSAQRWQSTYEELLLVHQQQHQQQEQEQAQQAQPEQHQSVEEKVGSEEEPAPEAPAVAAADGGGSGVSDAEAAAAATATAAAAAATAADHAEMVQELNAAIQQLQESLHGQQTEHVAAFQAATDAWAIEKTTLTNDIARLEAALTAARHETDQQQQQHQQQQDAHSVLGHLRSKLATLETELETERGHLHAAQIALGEKDTLLAQYDADLQAKHQDVKAKQAEVIALQNKVIDLQQTLQQQQEAVAAMLTAKAQEWAAQQAMALAEQQSRWVEEQQQQQQQQALQEQQTQDQARSEEEAAHEQQQLQLQQQQHQEAIEALQAQWAAKTAAWEAQVDGLSTQVEVEKQLAITLREEIVEWEARHRQLSEDMARVQDELAQVQAQVVTLTMDQDQGQAEVQRLTSDLQAVREELSTRHTEHQTLVEAHATTVASWTMLQTEYAAKQTEWARSLQMETEKANDLAASLVVLEESNQEKTTLLARKDQRIQELATQLKELAQTLATKEEHWQQEQAATASAAAARTKDALPPVPIFNNTVQLQDVEIRRLTTTVERVSKEVKQKEQELATLKTAWTKKEAEAATLKVHVETLQTEVDRLQKENDALMLKANDWEQLVRDHTAGSGASAGSGSSAATNGLVGRFAEYNVLPTSERMQVTEAMHLLHDFMLQMNAKHHVHQYFHLEGHRDLTTQDLPDLALGVKRSLQEIVTKMDTEVDGFAKILASKDKELALLKAKLLQNQTNDGCGSLNTSVNHSALVTSSPPRSTPPGSERKASSFLRSGEKSAPNSAMKDSFVTPMKGSTREPSINSGSRLGNTSGLDWSVEKSGGRRSLTVTPSAKEAARYHSELMKERKKLAVLQDEHADLLGLIAQQEVELSVFREKVQAMFGDKAIMTIEQEARDHVEKQYGVYTNFRDGIDA